MNDEEKQVSLLQDLAVKIKAGTASPEEELTVLKFLNENFGQLRDLVHQWNDDQASAAKE